MVHMVLPADRVRGLMTDLLGWLASEPVHPLIASCVFHYEFEFIHPFADGNGRMGRMWQTLILSQWQPMLAYLPVETVIKTRQTAYYEALAAADKQGDSTSFIEFMLHALLDAMTEALTETSVKVSEKTSEKIINALEHNHAMTISELAKSIGISTRSIERNLQKLQKEGRYIPGELPMLPFESGRFDHCLVVSSPLFVQCPPVGRVSSSGYPGDVACRW
ncbi:MAG: Fic family protein [Chlorobium sp.]